jgi:iron complex outermembrane receptor protein
MTKKSLLLGASILAALTGAAHAQTAPAGGDVYALGELQVTARGRTGEPVGGSVVAAEDMRRFAKPSLDRALDLVPGVNASNTGGSRNEQLIFVRGFDRFQTTLSIDGVRVFLPADNRIDFARFLTADLSEIQISKGYVSVLDGPGGLGGAINLVTIKPTAPVEGEVRAGGGFDRDGSLNSSAFSGRLGGRSDRFYAQISGAYNKRTHWALPADYTATTLENGGYRDHSDSKDWRINLKAGYTPNATDEYSVTYTRQEGRKNAPYHVTDTASTRYWSWPYWNIDSLAFLSTTALGDKATLRTRLYYNRFENLLSSFDNARQNSQTLGRAFNSYYDDNAWGGNISVDVALSDTNTLKGAAYFRRDTHVEWQQGFPAGTTEPKQETIENTATLAIEDTQALGPRTDLVVGVSYDNRDLIKAQDYNAGAFVYYPLKDGGAWNGQAALIYRPSDASQIHFSVSSRARFPTLFERFSSRFGTAVPNPGIKAERATSFELGGKTKPREGLTLQGAVFYSDLTDALISIPVVLPAPFGTTTQTKNAGDGKYYGAEMSVTAALTPTLTAGANYTYLHRKLTDPTNAAFRPTGAPTSKLFAYLDWRVAGRVTVTPSVEAASKRWTVTSSSLINPARFYKTGAYTLANLAVGVQVTPKVDIVLNARNLFDDEYRLVDGFPEEGRNFRADLRVRF